MSLSLIGRTPPASRCDGRAKRLHVHPQRFEPRKRRCIRTLSPKKISRKRQRDKRTNNVSLKRHCNHTPSKFYTFEQVQQILLDHRNLIETLLMKEKKLVKENQELKTYIQQHLIPPSPNCTYIS